MINFEKLVEGLLIIEQAPSKSSQPSSVISLENFIKSTDSNINPLRNLFSEYFNKEEFSYDDDIANNIKNVVDRAHHIAPRAVGAETAFSRAEKGAPMIDFLTYFTNKYLSKQPKNKDGKVQYSTTAAMLTKQSNEFPISELKNIADEFIVAFNEVNKSKGQVDSFKGYKPVTDVIQDLHAKYFGKKGDELIGKLALTNYDNVGIKKTIYGLLEVRKQIRSKQIKDKNIPNAIDFIDDILLNPQKYAGAQDMVPAKFKELYQDVHATKLIEISDAARQLFESESNRNKKSAAISEIFPNKVATTFNDFLNNKISEEEQIFTFDFKFEKAEGQEEGAKMGSTRVSDLKGGYTIKNIRDVLKSVPESRTQAATLIQRLEAFANYVRDEVGPDVVGGLKDLAQGFRALSAGLPSMGS